MKLLYKNFNNVNARVDIYHHEGKIYAAVFIDFGADYIEIDPSGNVRELTPEEWQQLLKTAKSNEID